MGDFIQRKFDVFGRVILVKRLGTRWIALYAGDQGLSRPAEDIEIPPRILEAEIADYLAVLCHEWSTPEKPDVIELE